MSDSIISVENLSKRYIIGRQRSKHDGLRHVMEEALHAPFRWLRTRREQRKREREEFWALKDVSFDVKQGEVVGIIGRNGAGKSTLLKILSRITEPTEGRVRLKGRVASLLEVGTGFHRELTGRENIFLNGAILGMGRTEIKSKLDEIVTFSEIEKFLDTPVKHYSSGMYVRLAFSIAAHLEPEILIVDEVLAVGDIEFQRKCLGKMKEVSREGRRTILFVSHNMAAVTSLTTRGILLLHGRVARDGTPNEVITDYLDSGAVKNASPTLPGKGEHTRLISVKMLDRSGTPTASYRPGQPIFLNVMFSTDGTKGLSLEFILGDANFNKLAFASLHQFHGVMLPAEAGTYSCCLQLGPMWLASGAYGIDVSTSLNNRRRDHYVERAVTFHVPFSNPTGLSWDFKFSQGVGAFAWLVDGEPRIERVTAAS
jgi:lipopolysaccharide transport system ATP-binding protein